MKNVQSIVTKIKKSGFFTFDINELIDIAKVRIEFEELIKLRAVNIPRRALPVAGGLKKSNLDEHHATAAGQSISIDLEDFNAGEGAYRDQVVHVTVGSPLVELPSLIDFVFCSFVQDIADEYLGGEAAIGYIKVKKSYANQINNRSYNHKFHIDDNAPKILKFIVYLNDVGAGGGAFHYVKCSHLDNEFRQKDAVTFEDTEIINSFGKTNVLEFIGNAGTCVICDTLGLHKEGDAVEADRYSIIVNYVLEPEYGGTRGQQFVDYDYVMGLPEKNQRLAKFLEKIQ